MNDQYCDQHSGFEVKLELLVKGQDRLRTDVRELYSLVRRFLIGGMGIFVSLSAALAIAVLKGCVG